MLKHHCDICNGTENIRTWPLKVREDPNEWKDFDICPQCHFRVIHETLHGLQMITVEFQRELVITLSTLSNKAKRERGEDEMPI